MHPFNQFQIWQATALIISLTALVFGAILLIIALLSRIARDRRRLTTMQHHLATVLNHAPIILFACDQKGTVTLSVGCGLEVLGHVCHEYEGHSIYDLYQNRPDALLHIQRVMVGETVRATLTIGQHIFESVYTPVLDKGVVQGFIGVATDISKRAHAEAALRESEARFRRFTEATVDGIVIHDGGVILDANSNVATKFGYTHEALLGKHLLDLVAPTSYAIVQQHIASGYERSYDVLGVKSDGLTFPLELCSKAMPSQGKTVYATSLRDTTSYKFVEAALRSSEERFRQLAEHINQVFWMASPTFDQMIYISPAYETIWGRSCIDVYEHPPSIFDAVHSADSDKVTHLDERLVMGKFDEEFRIIRPDGAVRWIQSRAFPIRNDQGIVYRIAGISEDITERKRVEEALAESSTTVRELYTIASAQHIDFDDRVHAFLEMGCKRFGLPIGLLSHIEDDRLLVLAAVTPDNSIQAGNQLPLAQTYCNIAVKSHEPVGIVHAALSSWNAHPCYAAFALEAYFGTPLVVRGKIYGTLCFLSHVPHHKGFVEADKDMLRLMAQWVSGAIEQRDAARELEDQYRSAQRAQTETRAVLDSTSEAIALIAPDHTVLTINRRFVEMFGISAEQIIGRPVMAFVSEFSRIFVDGEGFLARASAAMRHEDGLFTDMVTQCHPVQRELSLFSTPVFMGENDRLGQLYVFRDVTHERAVDRMKSEFVSLVSHELRTPLTSIKGYVDILLDGEVGPVPQEQQEFLGIIKNNTNRLVALINDLLDVAKIESGSIALRYTLVNIEDVVKNVVALLRPQIVAKRQLITVDLEPQLPQLFADGDRIFQIMTNLVSNAHKYTPAAGHIHICARACVDKVYISVQDDGIGLSEEERAHLFTRFYRARNRTTQEVGGTGLGLTITRSLIELHGGTISVASTPGAGTTFSFTLPIRQTSLEEATDA